MQPGSIVRLTHFVNHTPQVQMTYKAPKDMVFVVLMLGFEARDMTSQLNLKGALEAMGWMPDPEKFDPELLEALESQGG